MAAMQKVGFYHLIGFIEIDCDFNPFQKPKPSLPMPSKRTSVMATSPTSRDRKRVTDSSSDDDSILNESSSTPEQDRNSRPFSVGKSVNSSDTSSTSSPAHEMQAPPPRIIGVQEHSSALVGPQISHNQHRRKHQSSQPPLPPHQQQILKQHLINSRIGLNGSSNEYANNIPPNRPERISSRSDSGIANLADIQNLTPSMTYNAQPDVTSNTHSLRDSQSGN